MYESVALQTAPMSKVVFGEHLCLIIALHNHQHSDTPVGNVPYNMGEDQLVEVFKSVGQVVGFRSIILRKGSTEPCCIDTASIEQTCF